MIQNQVYLQMTTDANNNKFYNMVNNQNGTFTATWGRVGTDGKSKDYPIDDWNKVYLSKIRKGYEDVTDLRKKSTKSDYKPLDNKEIQDLIDILMKKSRQYTGSYYEDVQVTPIMLDKAQDILTELASAIDKKYTNDTAALDNFNRILLRLYTTLPRKMKNVRDELVVSLNMRVRKLKEEQDLVDNLRTQTMLTNTSSDTDILSALNLKVEPCTQDDLDIIKKALSDLDSKYVLNRAWVCQNNKRDEEFDDYLKNHNLKNDSRTVKYYWHGTRTENVFSIMANGLQCNPVNAHITGKMFGNGIYSAPKSKKSLNYTSLSGSYWAGGKDSVGYMFLNAVITGHKLNVTDNYYGGIYLSSLDGTKFNSNFADYHSVYAHSGRSLRNDEVIVYNSAQVASRYLVEIKYR